MTTAVALVKAALRGCADCNAAEVAAAGKGAVVSRRDQVGRGSGRRRFGIRKPRAPERKRGGEPRRGLCHTYQDATRSKEAARFEDVTFMDHTEGMVRSKLTFQS